MLSRQLTEESALGLLLGVLVKLSVCVKPAWVLLGMELTQRL